MLAFFHARGNFNLQGFLTRYNPAMIIHFPNIEGNLLFTAAKNFFQKQSQLGKNVFTTHTHTLPGPAAGTTKSAGTATTKDLLEKIAELLGIGFGVTTATETRRALPARGRLK